MAINYQDPTINLATRAAIPPGVNADLNQNPAWSAWRHVQQREPTLQLWLQMHASFLKTMGQIEAVSQGLIDAPAKDLSDFIRESNLLEGGQQLMMGLQQHHSMEDQIYFPKLVTLIPRLKNPLEMLDQDHIVLDQEIDSFNSLLDPLAVAMPSRQDVAALNDQATILGRLLKRHIMDEEDIILPDILEIGVERLLTD